MGQPMPLPMQREKKIQRKETEANDGMMLLTLLVIGTEDAKPKMSKRVLRGNDRLGRGRSG
jgi:hypothetical protein